MIRGKGIDTRFDIGEVLLPKSTHVREESFAVRNWRVGMGARPRTPALARPLRDPGHGEAVSQIPGDARQLTRAIGGASGEAGEGTVHVDPRLGRWARRCGACAKHRASRQASTVALSVEIGAGQGAVQGSDRILGAAPFHVSLALGPVAATKRAVACDARTAFRCELGMESWPMASASIRLTSTVKPKP